MDEKRKFNRWQVEEKKTTVIDCSGQDRNAALINISAGGMKISLPRPIDLGAVICSKLDVLSDVRPFFVKGKVIRIEERNQGFEAVVEFDQVSTVPLSN